MVVPQQSTATFAAMDAADRDADFANRINQLIFQALMIAFLVIMEANSARAYRKDVSLKKIIRPRH